MENLEKKIELANEKACEILNDVEFKDVENEIKAIEEVASYILSGKQSLITMEELSELSFEKHKVINNNLLDALKIIIDFPKDDIEYYAENGVSLYLNKLQFNQILTAINKAT